MKSFNARYGELLRKTIVPENASPEESLLIRKPLHDMIKENTPRKLFRYRKCDDYSMDAFRRNLIFFNTPNNFNDPYDCRVFLDAGAIRQEIDSTNKAGFQEVLETIVINKELPEAFKEAMPKEYCDMVIASFSAMTEEQISKVLDFSDHVISTNRNEIVNTRDFLLNHFLTEPRIACFTEEIRSLLMWSHYADSHKGFALEYDTDFDHKCLHCQHRCNCNDYAVCDLYPVVYSNDRYNATDMMFAFYLERIARIYQAPTEFISIPDSLALQKGTAYKALCWKYEKEWRLKLLRINPNNKRTSIECKPSAIYLGSEISEYNSYVLLSFAKEHRIPAYKMNIQEHQQKQRMGYTKI